MATILLVDDEAEILAWIADALTDVHEVIAVTDGNSALDILESNTPLDLLITDIRMPGLNGIALGRMAALRRAKLPILYMTAFSEEAVENAGLLLGGVLTKPFRKEVLLKAVEQAICRSVPA